MCVCVSTNGDGKHLEVIFKLTKKKNSQDSKTEEVKPGKIQCKNYP